VYIVRRKICRNARETAQRRRWSAFRRGRSSSHRSKAMARRCTGWHTLHGSAASLVIMLISPSIAQHAAKRCQSNGGHNARGHRPAPTPAASTTESCRAWRSSGCAKNRNQNGFPNGFRQQVACGRPRTSSRDRVSTAAWIPLVADSTEGRYRRLKTPESFAYRRLLHGRTAKRPRRR
jgi:hypothetical protein